MDFFFTFPKCFRSAVASTEDEPSTPREKANLVLTDSSVDEAVATPGSIVAYLRRKQSAAHTSNIEDVYDDVGRGRLLGNGATASVHVIREKNSGAEWACKEIPLKGALLAPHCL